MFAGTVRAKLQQESVSGSIINLRIVNLARSSSFLTDRPAKSNF